MGELRPVAQLELEVANFGPIAHAKLDLRPLTVFVGPSNTGKSYLAILIYALQATLARRLVPHQRLMHHLILGSRRGRTRTAGRTGLTPADVREVIDWIEATSLSDPADGDVDRLIPRIAEALRSAIETDRGIGNEMIDQIGRCFGVRDALERLNRFNASEPAAITLRARTSGSDLGDQILEYDLTLRPDDAARIRATNLPHPQASIADDSDWRFTKRMLRGQLARVESSEHTEQTAIARSVVDALAPLIAANALGPLAKSIYYLPADRTGVMHAHSVVMTALIDQSAEGGLRPRRELPILSGVLADFLRGLIEIGEMGAGNNQSDHVLLMSDLESGLLGGSIQLESDESYPPLITYMQECAKQSIPLMRASSMVSELAPVILYLRHLIRSGDTLIIEEPESHLHPQAQVQFATALAKLVNAGVRVIVTTHSEWILDQFANLVRMSHLPERDRADLPDADAALPADQFGAWLFRPEKPPAGTIVEELSIDPEQGGLASDYQDTAIGVHNTWASIGDRLSEPLE